MSVSNFVDRNEKRGSTGGPNYLGVEPPVIPVEGINVVEPFASVMNCTPNYKERAKTIDETCRFVFPIAFTIFIVIYWTYYLVV